MSHTGLIMKDLKGYFKGFQPEVDYQALMAQLIGFSHPRRKLREMQDKGQLIRLKKGFYVFSQDFIGQPHSPEIVANLLYGPSYLSLEYALSYYGLIPERVEALTSVTTNKNKTYATPIGLFTYQHMHSQIYPLGLKIQLTIDQRKFLMATPEKALVDLFSLKFRSLEKPNSTDIINALSEDLRVNMDELASQINRMMLLELQPHYQNRPWCRALIKYLLENL
jgi:predicted transcriptional regulator of viral defense system